MDTIKGINSLASDLVLIGYNNKVDNQGNVIIDLDLVKMLVNKPNTLDCRSLELDPTPDEFLQDKFYTDTVAKENGDYGKAIALYVNKNHDELNAIYSPPSAIGICQIPNGKFILVFKNKKQIAGFALPGGTLGKVKSDCGKLSQSDRASVYEQTLAREFLEECGIQLSKNYLLSAERPSSRLNHSCAVYLCQGKYVQGQREEDSDHLIVEVNFEQMINCLTNELAIDAFLIPLLVSQKEFILNYYSNS